MKCPGLAKRIICALFFIAVSANAAPGRGAPVQQERLEFSVTLSDGNTYPLVGYLYYKGSFRLRPLQVLVHGATYDHRYWDVPPIDGHPYSYARHMAREGYAVLAVDLLGAGESGRPDGDFLTLDESASGLHQVLSSLRTRHNPTGHAFHDIALIGHSLGSLISVFTQATYQDADVLVTTGFTHVPHTVPADPNLIAEILKSPYPAFPAEVRTALFYNPADADADVITFDNTYLATTLSRGLLLTILAAFGDPSLTRSTAVTVPVLAQLGEADALYPGSLAPGEAAFYPAAESITVQTLDFVGHSFNTHLDNLDGWRAIDEWIEDHI